jgi:RimJ/RimL family protein N-acetyltransferase
MTACLPARLQTERLVLREPRETDAALLFKSYTQDIEVARYTVWRPHTTLAETEAFIAQCIRNWTSGANKPYVLVPTEEPQQPIGVLEARTLSHIVDFGYVLSRSYWGRGLMPEAVCALAQSALEVPEVFRIQATCDTENLASARTLEKAGFVREGRLERHTMHPNISPEPRACFMYARCK